MHGIVVTSLAHEMAKQLCKSCEIVEGNSLVKV